eukprot:6182094-Pleurochrysis_carterae.AAC.3
MNCRVCTELTGVCSKRVGYTLALLRVLRSAGPQPGRHSAAIRVRIGEKSRKGTRRYISRSPT